MDTTNTLDVSLTLDTAQQLSPELIARVNDLCDRVEDLEREVTAVVSLRGGTAPPAWPGAVGIHLVNKWERALRRMERLRCVTIGIAQGWCAGLSLEVLLATDYRIATPDTELALPSVSGEFWPGMAVHRLANQLGVTGARRLVLFRSTATADEALAVGLLDDVTTNPMARAEEVAAPLRDVVGSELAIRRRLLLDATTSSFEDALGVHLAACDRALLRSRRDESPAGIA